MKWVEDKMEEAEKNGFLNNFDALMVAQISPNELKGVENSLKYGRELVTTFLKKYKFKTWKFTETNHKKVTEEMKNQRAEEIARKLSDHSLWKSHGRSLNIDTLNNELQLKINKIDDDEKISEIIRENFDLRPAAIIDHLKLRRPIYQDLAAHGHFGREDAGLTWEMTDKAEELKKYL